MAAALPVVISSFNTWVGWGISHATLTTQLCQCHGNSHLQRFSSSCQALGQA